MLLMNGLWGFHLGHSSERGVEIPFDLISTPPKSECRLFSRPHGEGRGTFLTGKAPYPVERTLLTSGMVEAALHSETGRTDHDPLAQRRLSSPQESQFFQQ